MSKRMVKLAITDTQMYLLAFVAGVIIGVIIFRMKNDIIYPAMCLYQELRVDKLKRNDIISASLLKYIAVERLKSFGLLFLTQITMFRRIVACVYCVVCGLACAVLEAFYVQEYALAGLVVFAATLMPHYIFYIMAWYRLCATDLPIKQISKSAVIDILKIVAVVLVFLGIGIICESVFNVWILKKFF